MAGETENTLGSKTEARIFVPESAVRSMAGKKVGRVSWNWHDTWQEEHKHSFVVAKMAKADLLNEVYESLQGAMKNGTPCAEWKKKILPKLEGRWIGKTIGELWDELPEEEKANRIPPSDKEREKVISPRRLDTIYRTNMHIAYMAGRYENQMASAEYLPYWRYRTVGDSRVRDSHRVLNNKVFKYDDPFWRTHYPPNGWGCRCEVSSLDEEEVKELGLTISSSEGHARTSADDVTNKPVITYEFDGKTARTAPGWNYNPADSLKASIEQAKEKAEEMPSPLREALSNDADEVSESQEPENAKSEPTKPVAPKSALAKPAVTKAEKTETAVASPSNKPEEPTVVTQPVAQKTNANELTSAKTTAKEQPANSTPSTQIVQEIEQRPKLLSQKEYKAWLKKQLHHVRKIHRLEKRIIESENNKAEQDKVHELINKKARTGGYLAKSEQVAAIMELPDFIINTRNSIIEEANQKARDGSKKTFLIPLKENILYIDIFAGAMHSIRKDKKHPNRTALKHIHKNIKRALISKEEYEGVFYEYIEGTYSTVHDGDIIFIVANKNLNKSKRNAPQLTKIVAKEHEGKLLVKTIGYISINICQSDIKNNYLRRIITN